MAGEALALRAGDELVRELRGDPPAGKLAPTMGNLKRCSYTHKALVELIIQQPELDQNELAAHFGYTPSWISNILASDAFQAQLNARREEVIDPVLKASIEERFKALTIQSLKVLQEKLSQNTVSDTVALRCAELGAKALGVGGHAVPQKVESSQDRLERLASRLVTLQSGVRERIIGAADGVQATIIENQPAEG